MGIKKLNLLTLLVTALALATTACHTTTPQQAKLPAPQANAPALAPVLAPLPQAIAGPAVADAQPAPQSSRDAVADLIMQVEREYQRGEERFKAGNLEESKQSFDKAADLLLQSPPEIRSDERLQHELERVLESVNRPELAALQVDSAGAKQKSEPAPIDETNEVTPPVDPNVKAQAEAEVQGTHSELPLMLTDPVAAYINYFSNRGHDILQHGLERGGRYREMIESTLREEGVPQELIYLAQAESGFHPLALSRVGARGMWQFMSSRARGYGLQHNLWVDERQDPEKATRAAAHHLKDLYNQFGDWYLAMAAYNSGPGSVQSAVKRTGYADFWELYKRNVLPKETRNYVPIILAVTIMAKNPAQYGLDDIVSGAAGSVRHGEDRLLGGPAPGRPVPGCFTGNPAGPESQFAALDYSEGCVLRTSPAGRNQGALSGGDRAHPVANASVVAVSRGGAGGHVGLDCSHLSHQPAGHRAGKSCAAR